MACALVQGRLIDMAKNLLCLIICALVVLISVIFSFVIIINWSKGNPVSLSIVLIITSMILSYSLGSLVRVINFLRGHINDVKSFSSPHVTETLNLISIYSLFTLIFIITGLHYSSFGTIIHGFIAGDQMNDLLMGTGADKLISLVALMLMYWMLDEMKKNINTLVSGLKNIEETRLRLQGPMIPVYVFILVLIMVGAYTLIMLL